MKKIGIIVREATENRIKDRLAATEALFIVKFSGLSSPDICGLRITLKASNASMFIVKNSIARRAFKELGFEALSVCVDGPSGIIFVKDDFAAVSKLLYNFAKDHEHLKFAAGLLNREKLLTQKDIEILAKLPSKDVLRGHVVCTLNAPIVGFVRVLSQSLRKFVYCIDQIKLKKEKLS